MHKVAFTAHNQATEPERIGRLKQTYGIAVAIAALADAATHDPELYDGDPVSPRNVIGMHDHKGTLIVVFDTIRAAEVFAPCFALAWRGMNEYLVEVECGHYRRRIRFAMEAA
jgi:hypothetical protein